MHSAQPPTIERQPAFSSRVFRCRLSKDEAMDKTKRCSKCKVIKSAGDFAPRPGPRCGLRSMCKVCSNEWNRKWRLDHVDEGRKKRRRRYRENREKEFGNNEGVGQDARW